VTFLSKIEAIHPRGRKFEREVPPKKGFSLPKGKALKERMDWIASSIHDLITDYNFRPATNKLMHEVQTYHSLITGHMPIKEKLEHAVKLANLIPKLSADIQRLYAKGALPENVDRKMIHTFMEEAKEIEKSVDGLTEKLKEYEVFEKSLQKLGFD
jgi:hypothetical protein